ncbi:hypothetical protein ACFW2Z_26725, partial [Streptomyces sp. NPDC058866]
MSGADGPPAEHDLLGLAPLVVDRGRRGRAAVPGPAAQFRFRSRPVPVAGGGEQPLALRLRQPQFRLLEVPGPQQRRDGGRGAALDRPQERGRTVRQHPVRVGARFHEGLGDPVGEGGHRRAQHRQSLRAGGVRAGPGPQQGAGPAAQGDEHGRTDRGARVRAP